MAAGFDFCFYSLEAGQFRVQKGQLSGDTDTTRRELAEIAGIHFPKERQGAKLRAKVIYRLYNSPRYFSRVHKMGL